MVARLLIGAILVLTACTPAPRPAGVTVFAAASLTDVMTTLGADFEQDTGIPVTFSFAGSADLVAQLANGAPGDLLATADPVTMGRARAAGVVTETPTTFASNTLTVAVAPGNPQRITGLADLTRPELAVVVCARQVPCGATTVAVTAAAKVTLTPVSEENSVTDVLGKVTSGQADAGIVWSTDIARARGGAEAVVIPQAAAHPSRYQAARVAGSAQSADPDRFLAHLAGPDGRRALTEAGFGVP